MGVLVFVYFMLTVLLVGNIYHTRHCSLIFLNYLAFWFDPSDIMFALSRSLSTSTGGRVSQTSVRAVFFALCFFYLSSVSGILQLEVECVLSLHPGFTGSKFSPFCIQQTLSLFSLLTAVFLGL